jgi:hypothetical protein
LGSRDILVNSIIFEEPEHLVFGSEYLIQDEERAWNWLLSEAACLSSRSLTGTDWLT